MSMTLEKEYENLLVAQEVEASESDLIRELGRRLGSLWGLERNIANATETPELLEFWRRVKSQEQRNIEELKLIISRQAQTTCS